MGIASTSATTGKPTYNNTSATQSDLQAGVDFADTWATRRSGPTGSLPTTLVKSGDEYYDTTLDNIYIYRSGGWKLLQTATPVVWTPTIGNMTIGNGTMLASYTVSGGRCFVRVSVVFGSTTTITATPSITLPLAAASAYGGTGLQNYVGGVRATDAGVNNYIGNVSLWATDITKVVIDRFVVSGANVLTSSYNATTPFTWGNGDCWSASFDYELA